MQRGDFELVVAALMLFVLVVGLLVVLLLYSTAI